MLVLNRSYLPVHIVGIRRAFTLLYLGVARALDREYRLLDFESWAQVSAQVGDDTIGTVRQALVVPRILVLQSYDRLPRREVRFSRMNIYLRDRNTCQYCGRRLPRPELNLDHVVPRSQGGKTSWVNVVCCCIPCNLEKGGRTPEQAGMKLLKAPARPSWAALSRLPEVGVPYREWRPFLVNRVDAAYWNVELEEG